METTAGFNLQIYNKKRVNMITQKRLSEIKIPEKELKELKEILKENGKTLQSIHGSHEGAIALYFTELADGRKSHGYGRMVDIITGQFFKK